VLERLIAEGSAIAGQRRRTRLVRLARPPSIAKIGGSDVFEPAS
jgi:hypothetical protein